MLWKVMEFSIRRLLDEIVYVTLDFESGFGNIFDICSIGYNIDVAMMELMMFDID